jgi:hypothetical protein
LAERLTAATVAVLENSAPVVDAALVRVRAPRRAACRHTGRCLTRLGGQTPPRPGAGQAVVLACGRGVRASVRTVRDCVQLHTLTETDPDYRECVRGLGAWSGLGRSCVTVGGGARLGC